MAAWIKDQATMPAPDEQAILRSIAEHDAPFERKPGNLERIREALYECMWQDVGVLRTAEGLQRAAGRLEELARELDRTGVPVGDRAYNLTWHDWINLRSLVGVSRVITAAAISREDSRGAHAREDFPDAGDLHGSSFTVARQIDGVLEIAREPVQFTRVRPGETILQPEAVSTAA